MARRTRSEYKDNSARHQESTDVRMKEHREIEKDAERLNTRLSDQTFISKAPQAVVDKERARLQTALDKLTRLRQELTQLTQ